MAFNKKLEICEFGTIKRLLDIYPSGVVSIVSDSFDFWSVITRIAPRLKDKILSRTPDDLGLAKVVFRPDSGDPVKILTGYRVAEVSSTESQHEMSQAELGGYEAVYDKSSGKYYTFEPYYDEWAAKYSLKELSVAEAKGAVECLDYIFGSTENSLGFRTLNPRVGLIYGDSITLGRAEEILERLAHKGYASDNVVFGIGSYTFQYTTRDTLGFAMKATYVEINGEGQAIFKDPKTDDGTKKSARGLLRVDRVGTDFVLRNNVSVEEERGGELTTVFLNGKIVREESFSDIRSRLGVI